MEDFPRFDLNGQVALVTGAARGLGHAISLALAAPGANVADVIDRIAALHRIGEPMEVAGALAFLTSPAASLIARHTLLIDGGWTAR